MKKTENPYTKLYETENVGKALRDDQSDKLLQTFANPEEQISALQKAKNKKRSGRPKKGDPRPAMQEQINIRFSQEDASLLRRLSLSTAKTQKELMVEAINYLRRHYRIS